MIKRYGAKIETIRKSIKRAHQERVYMIMAKSIIAAQQAYLYWLRMALLGRAIGYKDVEGEVVHVNKRTWRSHG